jgi:ParB family chromosome partitioning protein
MLKLGDMVGIVDNLPLSQLIPSLQAIRSDMTDIEKLAKSIKENGLLHPIVVRSKSENLFEIVAGNRRYNACKMLGWKQISCHIVEMDDKSAYEVSLIENVQRRSMDPIQEGLAFKKYIDEYGWGSMTELAKRIGKSNSYVSRRIALLNLPKDVLEAIRNQEIAASTSEELLNLDQAEQSQLARLIATRHLSLKKTREIVTGSHRTYDLDHEFIRDLSEYDVERQKVFDKMIVTLRLALSKVGPIIEGTEDDWVIHEILMYHKNLLHDQIDLLLREKRSLSRTEKHRKALD